MRQKRRRVKFPWNLYWENKTYVQAKEVYCLLNSAFISNFIYCHRRCYLKSILLLFFQSDQTTLCKGVFQFIYECMTKKIKSEVLTD